MTAAAPAAESLVDWRTIVGGGAKLGILTAVGVAVFSLASSATTGATETIVQSVLVFAGMFAFAYLPSMLFRPHDTDTIAWTAMLGLMGALFFTVVDTAVLRPLDIYHYRWDDLGGGSGFWYIPVWFMGSAVLAWLGGWVVANSGAEPVWRSGAKSAVLGVVAAGGIIATGLVSFAPAAVALGFTLALIVHVPVSSKMKSG